NITDSRFQQELCDWAKSHKKLPAGYEIPERFLRNTPENIKELLKPFRNILPDFPFGHDFTDDELVIVGALQKLKQASSNPLDLLATVVASVFSDKEVPERYLERMGFDETVSIKEKLLQKIFAGNL
ncbi:MAG TPA: hypothetical protein VLB90_02590, partial [Pseudomonadales bacterium]|nr:hypothetical protein [Pseudomonadales bacterium]